MGQRPPHHHMETLGGASAESALEVPASSLFLSLISSSSAHCTVSLQKPPTFYLSTHGSPTQMYADLRLPSEQGGVAFEAELILQYVSIFSRLYLRSSGISIGVIRLQEVGATSSRHHDDGLNVLALPSSSNSVGTTCLGIQLRHSCQHVLASKVTGATTHYTGSTSTRPGYPKRLRPAMPKTVWKTSTISPGRSEIPPLS